MLLQWPSEDCSEDKALVQDHTTREEFIDKSNLPITNPTPRPIYTYAGLSVAIFKPAEIAAVCPAFLQKRPLQQLLALSLLVTAIWQVWDQRWECQCGHRAAVVVCRRQCRLCVSLVLHSKCVRWIYHTACRWIITLLKPFIFINVVNIVAFCLWYSKITFSDLPASDSFVFLQ